MVYYTWMRQRRQFLSFLFLFSFLSTKKKMACDLLMKIAHFIKMTIIVELSILLIVTYRGHIVDFPNVIR